MRKRTQQQIDNIIRDKHALGYVPSDIAPFVHLPTIDVRLRMGELGIVPHGRQPNKPIGYQRSQAEVDAFIIERADLAPSSLAHRLGLPTETVRARMIELGLEIDDWSTAAKYQVHPMWSGETSDDDRREAIWQRQRDGARAALREVSGNIP